MTTGIVALSATMSLYNTTATTINFGAAAAINMGRDVTLLTSSVGNTSLVHSTTAAGNVANAHNMNYKMKENYG